MDTPLPRKPAGTPAGGEFANKTGSAPTSTLTRGRDVAAVVRPATCDHCEEPVIWDAENEQWVGSGRSPSECSSTGGHYSDDDLYDEAAALPHGWNARDVEDCFDAYLECAAWSSTVTDSDGQDVPADSLDAEFSEAAKQTLRKDLDDFLVDNAVLLNLAAAQHEYSKEQAGHDFWLTRNGHGAGFWDRGLGPIGDQLSAAAKVYGSADLYLGDSGELEAH